MLHTVNKSPFEKNSLDTCLRLAQAGSAILLIEDAVYAAMQDTAVAPKLQHAVNTHRLYVLEPDMQARGLEPQRLIEGIERVDYAGFVKLAAEHERCQSWL